MFSMQQTIEQSEQNKTAPVSWTFNYFSVRFFIIWHSLDKQKLENIHYNRFEHFHILLHKLKWVFDWMSYTIGDVYKLRKSQTLYRSFLKRKRFLWMMQCVNTPFWFHFYHSLIPLVLFINHELYVQLCLVFDDFFTKNYFLWRLDAIGPVIEHNDWLNSI